MPALDLATAEAVLAATLAHAATAGMKPLAVAVLDAGAQLVTFRRQDGTAGTHRADIAVGKAAGALAVGAGSRWLNTQQDTRPHFLAGLIGMTGGRMIPVPGGVLVRDPATGAILGAVGVSGDTSDNDEAAAVAGIAAAGLKPDAG